MITYQALLALFRAPALAQFATAEARAKERQRRAAITAAAAVIAKLVRAATALISVPLTLHYLGPERYGMWMIITSLVAVLTFADFGLGSGLLNAVADAYGADDTKAIRAYISSGFLALASISCGIALAFAVSYPVVNWYRLFNVHTQLARSEAAPALAAFVICFALAIPAGIVQRVQMGMQRGFHANVWQCAGSVISLIGVLIAIICHASLPWLVLAFVGAPLVTAVMNSFVFFVWLEPDIAPRVSTASWRSIRQIARTGLLFFGLQVGSSMAYALDNIIVAQRLGADIVSNYAVPERMFSIVTMLLALAVTPLWPAYREAIAKGDHPWVRRVLARSLLTSVGVSTAVSSMLVVVGPSLIRLWVNNSVAPSLALLVGLAIWKVMEAAGTTFAIYLNGVGALRLQVIALVLTACAATALKVLLMPHLGVAAIPYGSIIANLAFTLPMFVGYWWCIARSNLKGV